MTDSTSVKTAEEAAAATSEAGAQPSEQPALELDCRGLACPLPILKTKKAMDGLAVGQLLKMVATDPGSVPDVAAFSRRTGHEVVSQSEGGGEFVFVIRKV